MLVHRRERRQAEPAADFLETRRVAVLLNELLQVVENLALAFGEGLHVTLRDPCISGRTDYTQRKGEDQQAPGNWGFRRPRLRKA